MLQESQLAPLSLIKPRELSFFSSFPTRLWTGTSWNDAIACEEKLLRRYVHSQFQLGRVPVDLPSLGLGRQHINILDVNPSVSKGVPIVWLHGAGSGLGFGFGWLHEHPRGYCRHPCNVVNNPTTRLDKSILWGVSLGVYHGFQNRLG